jgi:hypothetical protein
VNAAFESHSLRREPDGVLCHEKTMAFGRKTPHCHRVVITFYIIMNHTTLVSQDFLNGCEDAAFGQLPRYPHEDYLTGYISTVRKLPLNPDGTISHYSPKQHFAFGQVDSPDPYAE